MNSPPKVLPLTILLVDISRDLKVTAKAHKILIVGLPPPGIQYRFCTNLAISTRGRATVNNVISIVCISGASCPWARTTLVKMRHVKMLGLSLPQCSPKGQVVVVILRSSSCTEVATICSVRLRSNSDQPFGRARLSAQASILIDRDSSVCLDQVSRSVLTILRRGKTLGMTFQVSWITFAAHSRLDFDRLGLEMQVGQRG